VRDGREKEFFSKVSVDSVAEQESLKQEVKYKGENMCRSIKPLRNMDHPVTEQEIQEAALQYIRKVSGYRKPSKVNQEAFDTAIAEVAESTRRMLENLHTPKNIITQN
jgi:hypothetical protein